MLITFDGVDGAGKTMHAAWLAEQLTKLGYSVVLTREPGGTAIGQMIRQLLLHPPQSDFCPRAELLLYAADRAQHVQTCIVPALQKGHIVVSDRFADASIVYQAYGMNLDLQTITTINAFATQGLTPDRTYICDVSLAVSMQRRRKRAQAMGVDADRIEQRDESYFARVRQGFLQLTLKEPIRIQLLDCEQSPEAIQQQLWEDMQRFFRQLDRRSLTSSRGEE